MSSRTVFKIVVAMLVPFVSTGLCQSKALEKVGEAHHLLRWLPPDTETIMVGHGPFRAPTGKSPFEDRGERSISPVELLRILEFRLFTLLYMADTHVAEKVGASEVVWIVDAARHFRQPTSLGAMLYQGCTIVEFNASIGTANSFVTRIEHKGIRFEEVLGFKVAVMSEKSEDDIWTIFVAQPTSTTLIVGTDREYLTTVLHRIGSSSAAAKRALPTNLPEWGYVDTSAPFWAIRHYDKSQKTKDPTSGSNDGVVQNDTKAIGLTFSFDPAHSDTAVVHYFSGDTQLESKLGDMSSAIKANSEGLKPEAATALIPKISIADAGIYRLEFRVRSLNAAAMFQFFLDAWLGHAVLV